MLENVEGVKKSGPAACQAPSVNQRSGQTSSLISGSLNIPGYLLMPVKMPSGFLKHRGARSSSVTDEAAQSGDGIWDLCRSEAGKERGGGLCSVPALLSTHPSEEGIGSPPQPRTSVGRSNVPTRVVRVVSGVLC